MDILNFYFGNLYFEKTLEKKGFFLYVAALKTMVGGDRRRFIVAFVNSNNDRNPLSQRMKLNQLNWSNLQVREMEKTSFDVSLQTWVAPVKDIPHINFTVYDRDDNYSYYKSDYPTFENIQLMMVHSSKKKTQYQFPNAMNLHYTIDQYACVFTQMGHIEYENTTIQHGEPYGDTQSNNVELL